MFPARRFAFAGGLAATLATFLTLTGCATSGGFPDSTTEGLPRVESKAVDALYRKEGATLEGYKRVHVARCDVQFYANWQRDMNRQQWGDSSSRVTEADMERIRSGLARIFEDEFSEALIAAGYTLTDTRGGDVLLLKPSIINLWITAPDVSRNQTTQQTTYVTDPGQMTLSMDFFDALHNELLGRAIDKRVAGSSSGQIRMSNAITNRAEAEVIIEAWARRMVEALDEANGK